jgi:drug/metabolite transporter (DMT)-like permease
MLAWSEESKATLTGPAAAALAKVLDQVMWHRFISPCQWAGIAILLVCSAIAIWKYLDQADLDDKEVTFLSAVSKVASHIFGH